MKRLVFITGNQAKADYLAKWLGYPVEHQKVDLDELQSLDPHAVIEHKAKEAYKIVGEPVLVEDVRFSLSTSAFVIIIFSFGDRRASSVTMAVINLVIEAMGITLSAFLS